MSKSTKNKSKYGFENIQHLEPEVLWKLLRRNSSYQDQVDHFERSLKQGTALYDFYVCLIVCLEVEREQKRYGCGSVYSIDHDDILQSSRKFWPEDLTEAHSTFDPNLFHRALSEFKALKKNTWTFGKFLHFPIPYKFENVPVEFMQRMWKYRQARSITDTNELFPASEDIVTVQFSRTCTQEDLLACIEGWKPQKSKPRRVAFTKNDVLIPIFISETRANHKGFGGPLTLSKKKKEKFRTEPTYEKILERVWATFGKQPMRENPSIFCKNQIKKLQRLIASLE